MRQRAAPSWATTVAIGVEEERETRSSSAKAAEVSSRCREHPPALLLAPLRLLALLLLQNGAAPPPRAHSFFSTQTTCAASSACHRHRRTRGIGRISDALGEAGFDLLLTYNSDAAAAEAAAAELKTAHGCGVTCVGGDISLESTRDAIFGAFEAMSDVELGAVVHNAGQYVGITSDNADGLKGGPPLGFGDGSLLSDGKFDFAQMHYYQRMYGDAYVDLCERGLARMTAGGSLVGISSPGCTTQYNANAGYDMPGSGKCVMEYAMRLFALRCAGKDVNCNVVVPGVTTTDAWAASPPRAARPRTSWWPPSPAASPRWAR